MQRRTVLQALLAILGTGAYRPTFAQSWPNRPIRLLQGFGPGGNADTIARLIGTEIGKGVGQPVIVEARAGAGGNLAAEAVARAVPDGHTLLLMTGGHPVSGALYKALPFDPVDSFEMISTISLFPFLLVVRADSPFQSLRSLIDAAKAKPESVAYGTAGIGSTHHLTGELLAKTAGVSMLHVPYKGDAAAITALLGGELGLVVATPTVAVANVKAGKLRVLAVSGNTRWSGMPDVPTADEAGVPGFDVRSWIGLATVAGTPREIVGRLNAEVSRAIQMPEIKTRLESFGGEAQSSSPQDMRTRVSTETQRWKKVIVESRIPQQ